MGTDLGPTDFPLVLSPNLGCPVMISVEELKAGGTISLIIAEQYGEYSCPLRDAFTDILSLRPSHDHGAGTGCIPLNPAGDPEEITTWNVLHGFSELDDTRELIISELHYNILGENTRYWKLPVSIESRNGEFRYLLEKKEGKYVTGLYDLILKDENNKSEKINHHAVQFIDSFRGACNFIHLTDPHVATRNDEILGEVLKIKNERSRSEIKKTYLNFNDNLRKFIARANEMADRGELDFVIITGDLVDFAFHGWDDDSNPDENNWRTFINICTGMGNEKKEGNPGLKVASYTSTGNHDWRLHPYNPSLANYNRSFGLEKDELKNYNYKSFNSVEYPEDKRAELSRRITDRAFAKLNLDAFADSGKVKLAKFLSEKFTTRVLLAAGGVSIGGVGVAGYMEKFIYAGILAALGLVVWGLKIYLTKWVQKQVDFIIDNPLHAEAKSLHYYLKHINPYLDYAFRYGDRSFIVMDTGADVFSGQLLDGKTIRDIKKMSIEDNILGGSPDSRAFDSEQSYYNWSQIVWLEYALAAVGGRQNGRDTIMVFLHSPPINAAEGADFKWSNLWERNRQVMKWISENEFDLTYGSINHYVSQFFYLCLGSRESELSQSLLEGKLKKVDLVFSGHTHRNIEFRLAMEPGGNGDQFDIRIFSDVYSQLLDVNNPGAWWRDHRPVVVQTAACGSAGKTDDRPPYFRKVLVTDRGEITDFRVRNLDGAVSFIEP